MNDPDSTAIDAETLRAYRATDYDVLAAPPFTLRVDEPSEALARLLAAHSVRECAFITAYNPLGKEPDEKLGEEPNASRQAALETELRARGVTYLPAEGRAPDGSWCEPSFLALGLTRSEACALGRAHAQNAILCAEEGGVPELVLLR